MGGIPTEHISLNFYIEAGTFCPAKCFFCPGYKKHSNVDLLKLEKCFKHLHEANLINRIAITGAEPLFCNELDDILSIIKDHGYHISLNTSSCGMYKFNKLKNVNVLDDIHVSRHHYDDIKNQNIFGVKVCTENQLTEFAQSLPISLSANLLRSYINSTVEVKNYLEHAIAIRAKFVGFVSLMNKTDLCEQERVDFSEFDFSLKDGFLFRASNADKSFCKCENYTYANHSDSIEFYQRAVCGKSTLTKRFVFTDNKLTTGFGGEVLL
jgi:molybdenum cofactor biosynthesis enzyme MoaA